MLDSLVPRFACTCVHTTWPPMPSNVFNYGVSFRVCALVDGKGTPLGTVSFSFVSYVMFVFSSGVVPWLVTTGVALAMSYSGAYGR